MRKKRNQTAFGMHKEARGVPMHKLVYDDELPINQTVVYFRDDGPLDNIEDKMRFRDLLLMELAYNITKSILHQTSVRQDYLDYMLECFFISEEQDRLHGTALYQTPEMPIKSDTWANYHYF